MTQKPQNEHSSDLTEWLKNEGVESTETGAEIKLLLVGQLEEAMGELGISKSEMARRMNTSRAAVDRLLSSESEGVTLSTLQKAAAAVGRELRLELLTDYLHARSGSASTNPMPLLFVGPAATATGPGRSRLPRISSSPFFEVTASQISLLDQYGLVELLRRLIAEELLAAGVPLRSLSVPAQITIADGGEDGRVDWWGGPNDTHYLPSRFCIFQSKLRDPGAAGLKKETWTKGSQRKGAKPQLSDAIAELLARGGSYVVATAAPLTGQKIKERISAVRRGIEEADGEADRLTEIRIYDANALANWASTLPSVGLWLNELQRRVFLGGFQSYASWGRANDIATLPFVEGAQARFNLLGSAPVRSKTTLSAREALTFSEVTKIIVPFLSKPNKTLRIIGPSGYGKSRFLYELFSTEQRPHKLPSTSIVFAQYETVHDRLGAIALELAESGSATILIVDDCPDAAHQELAKIAKREGSRLRVATTSVETRANRAKDLLIVELAPASDDMIDAIAKLADDGISQQNVSFVRELANGFPRMAILAAEAIKEQQNPIATVEELVDRIVWGRRQPERAAELSLQLASLFTFVGVDGSASEELTALSNLVGSDRTKMYEHLAMLEDRGVVRRTGDYVEIQPLPLAVILGSRRLDLSPDGWLVELYSASTPEMQQRLLGRLRWLDRSPKVQQFAEKLLDDVSNFDLLNTDRSAKWVDRLVHVRPDLAMATLERLLGNLSETELQKLDDGRRHVVWALEKLVFRNETFVPAATLLRRLGAAETEKYSNNATGLFISLYQLHLSGTEAGPDLKLQVLDEGLASSNEAERSICINALEKMLHRWHFSRGGGSEQIGSATPLSDWEPSVWAEVFDFHRSALDRLKAIALSNDSAAKQATSNIASNIRGLLGLPPLLNDIERVIDEITAYRGLWADAISGVNSWIYYDSLGAPADYAAKVRALYERILPADIIEQAVLYTSGWATDLNDPDRPYREADEHDFGFSQRKAEALAVKISTDKSLITSAVKTLVRGPLNGVYPFAWTLGAKCGDPKSVLAMALAEVDSVQDGEIESRFFNGLLAGADSQSHSTGIACLKLALSQPALESYFVGLLGSVRVDAEVLSMAIDFLTRGIVQPRAVASLSFGKGLDHLRSGDIEPLLSSLIAHSTEAMWAALEAITMYQHGRSGMDSEVGDCLKRILLHASLFHIQSLSTMDSHHLEVGVTLLNRHGYLDEETAGHLAGQILSLGRMSEYRIQLSLDRTIHKILRLLLEKFPFRVWTILAHALENDDSIKRYRLRDLLGLEDRDAENPSPLNAVPRDIWLAWLAENPTQRIAHVLGWLPLIQTENEERQWHPDLEHVVDAFVTQAHELEAIEHRFLPGVWWGSLANQLEPYLPLLKKWHSHRNAIVRSWALSTHARLQKMIAEQRRRDDNDDVHSLS